MTSPPHYDVVIIGGGLAGISLAVALGHSVPGLRLALIEAQDYRDGGPPGFDSRTVALSYSSRQIFAALGLWDDALRAEAAPISTIHISDRGHPGMTRLSAREQGVEALGYVIENRVLGRRLVQALETQTATALYAPAHVTDLALKSSVAEITLQTSSGPVNLAAGLVVAADGMHSFVRQHLGVQSWRLDYHQHAVIANLAVDQSHHGRAHERFTADGPIALLPLLAFAESPYRYSLVWTVPESHVDQMRAWNDATFLQQLQQQFGERAGTFIRVGRRQVYPLGLVQSRESIRPRLAIVGNAAHTLHPVAGQGFNLGLRDVAVLAQVIRDAYRNGTDIGALTTLQRYARWRGRDQVQTALFTDTLVRVFSTDSLPVVLARNLGLMTMELCSPLRKHLARQAMGFIGKSSWLARGLAL